MAYVQDLKKDEEEKKGQQAGLVGEQTSTGQSSVITGSDQGDQSGQTGAPQTQAAQQVKTGGGSGWTNLQQYKDANINNDASMAGAIRGSQKEKLKSAEQAYGSLQKDLGTQMQSSVPSNFGAVQERLKSDPTDVSQSEFDKYYNYEYRGPQQLEEVGSYQKAQEQRQSLADTAKRSKEYSGVADLLREVYGKEDDYTRGENILDAFITQSGDRGQYALGQMREQFGRAGEGFGEKEKYLQQQIQDTAAAENLKGQQFRGQTQAQLDQWLGDMAAAREGLEGSLGSGFGDTGSGIQGKIYGEDELRDFAEQGSGYDTKLAALSGLLGEQYQSTDFNTLADQLLAAEEADLQSRIAAEQARQAQRRADEQAEAQRQLDQQAQEAATRQTTDIMGSIDPYQDIEDTIYADPVTRAETLTPEVVKEAAKKDPIVKEASKILGWG